MFRLNENVRLRKIEADESYWIFDINDGSQYEVNETAYKVLCGVKAGQSSTQIVAEIIDEFEIPHDEVADDVKNTLAEFEQLGLILKEEVT